MEDPVFETENGVLKRYRGHDAVVSVPEGITEIGGSFPLGRSYDENADRYYTRMAPGAFSGLDFIEEVRLPLSVTAVGPEAFRGCHALRKVTLPEGLLSVGEFAFAESALRFLAVPGRITEIPEGAFFSCTQLEEVVLPETLGSIGRRAFDNCLSLARLSLPRTLREIGPLAFSYCRSLTELHLPGSVVRAGDQLCRGCSALDDVSFPETVSVQKFCDSLWYVRYMERRGRCPACGAEIPSSVGQCVNPSCPTQYGKWER